MEISHIRWVITVPAIWSDAAKQFMREAAFRAGLITEIDSDKLVIALEPEAASVFIQTSKIEYHKEDNNGMNLMKPGTKYMVIDAGGIYSYFHSCNFYINFV
jgi:molecular chaperone DnaK (HSP70)